MFWTWSCFIKSIFVYSIVIFSWQKFTWFILVCKYYKRRFHIHIVCFSVSVFILIVNKIPLVTYRFTRVSPEFWSVNNVKIRSISIPNLWFHTAFVLSFSKEFARDVTLILIQKADWKPTFYIKYWRFHGETYYYSVIYYDKISI